MATDGYLLLDGYMENTILIIAASVLVTDAGYVVKQKDSCCLADSFGSILSLYKFARGRKK